MAIGILKEILCNSIDINGSENWKTKFIKSQLGSLIQIPEMIYENTFIYWRWRNERYNFIAAIKIKW